MVVHLGVGAEVSPIPTLRLTPNWFLITDFSPARGKRDLGRRAGGRKRKTEDWELEEMLGDCGGQTLGHLANVGDRVPLA